MDLLKKVFCLPFVCCVVLSQEGPVVETTYGSVMGTYVTLENGDVIDSYLNIPFAKPPLGELRFAPPEIPEPFDVLYEATELGNACYQTGYEDRAVWTQTSEDCLNLNIYSKQRDEGVLQPVLVWIYGGSFQTGANFIYPGYFLADKDVVLVTVNYRLGIMGFASTGDDVVPGNMGLLDQILALQYIQDNIAAFGGDPNRVTLFGQSAGASSIGLLESAPQAEGLFHAAILQSGTESAPWTVNVPKTNPTGYLHEVAESFNCSTDDSQIMVDCLRKQDAEELNEAEFRCTLGTMACLGFQPVIDGDIVADLPILMRYRGEFHRVPEMIGHTSEDAFAYVPPFYRDGATREEMEVYFAGINLYHSVLWPDQSRAGLFTEAQSWYYADWPYINDTEANRRLIGESLTDHSFAANADLHAKTSAGSEMPVYYYVYRYLPENQIRDWTGTVHSDELEIVFGRPFLWDNPEALNHSQIELDDTEYTEADKLYSDFIMTLWTNFAKFGEPTPEPIGPGDENAIDWIQYTTGDYNYALLDAVPLVDKNYRQKEFAFYNYYMRNIIYGFEF